MACFSSFSFISKWNRNKLLPQQIIINYIQFCRFGIMLTKSQWHQLKGTVQEFRQSRLMASTSFQVLTTILSRCGNGQGRNVHWQLNE
jgi:hypothetical protein